MINNRALTNHFQQWHLDNDDIDGEIPVSLILSSNVKSPVAVV